MLQEGRMLHTENIALNNLFKVYIVVTTLAFKKMLMHQMFSSINNVRYKNKATVNSIIKKN